MSTFGDAHIATRFRFRYAHLELSEYTLECPDRRKTAVIDGSSGPVKDDRPQTAAHCIPFRVCSASPKERVMPIPLVTVITSTPAAGEKRTNGLSGCFA